MKKTISLFLAFIMILSIGSIGALADGYELKEVSTVEDEDGDYNVYRGLLCDYYDGVFFSAKGEELDLEDLFDADEIFNVSELEDGLITVTVSDEDVNGTGLMNIEGEVLCPSDAAIFSAPYDSNYDEWCRYICVIYGTEEVEHTDEAMFYVTADMFSFGDPDDDDILYAGYVEILDTKTGEFIEDLSIESPDYDVEAGLEGFVYRDEDDVYHVYNGEGEEILDTEERVYCYKDFYVVDSTAYTFDNEEIVSDDSLTVYNGYIVTRNYEEEEWTIVNLEGEVLAEGSTDDGSVYDVGDSTYELSNYNDETDVLYTFDGEEIISVEDAYFYYCAQDVWLCKCDDAPDFFVNADGDQLEDEENFGSSLYSEAGFLNLAALEPVETDSYPSIVDKTFAIGEEDDEVFLFDITTGEELLSGMEEIYCIGNYVFAYADEEWTIYEIEEK